MHFRVSVIGAFNRTNLEQKQFASAIGVEVRVTFNRTNLEQKRGINNLEIREGRLLIEPIWNRNADTQDAEGQPDPAFNRTNLEQKLYEPCRNHIGIYLLIEPIWNRNPTRDQRTART